MRYNFSFGASLLLIFLLGCSTTKQITSTPIAPVNVKADSITFAVIGDYGSDSPQEDSVAKMVKSWNPDFIITTGDNNYFTGSASTINAHIGKYYCDYIYNPDAPANEQCNGKATRDKVNRFFPSPGNHDNYAPHLKPYLDYFTLPGNEKDYDFSWGPVHFYSINSGIDGKIDSNSPAATWLKKELAKNTSPFKFVYFHHPPYSGGHHGSSKNMRWPFTQWGVDAVLCGHEHFYARVKDKTVANPIYFICGNSGTNEHYATNTHPLDPNRFEYITDNIHFGSIKVTATTHKVTFEYFVVEKPDHPVDIYVITK